MEKNIVTLPNSLPLSSFDFQNFYHFYELRQYGSLLQVMYWNEIIFISIDSTLIGILKTWNGYIYNDGVFTPIHSPLHCGKELGTDDYEVLQGWWRSIISQKFIPVAFSIADIWYGYLKWPHFEIFTQ